MKDVKISDVNAALNSNRASGIITNLALLRDHYSKRVGVLDKRIKSLIDAGPEQAQLLALADFEKHFILRLITQLNAV